MSVKILGGTLKGLNLKVLEVQNLRPTSVILRRKFFDSFQEWTDIHFCDFYAGTGSMGWEALSRGAESVHFNEKNRKAYDQLKVAKDEVLARSNFNQDQISISQIDALKSFKNLSLSLDPEKTYCFFIDPPYGFQSSYLKFFEKFKELIGKGDYFIVIEGDKNQDIPLAAWQEQFPKSNCLWHGDHFLFMTWL